MKKAHAYRHILIIADIEGSSGCGSYRASSFLTRPWVHACAAMSRDVDTVVKALFDTGVERVTVKDFHRTGYNLLPEMIDRRAAAKAAGPWTQAAGHCSLKMRAAVLIS